MSVFDCGVGEMWLWYLTKSLSDRKDDETEESEVGKSGAISTSHEMHWDVSLRIHVEEDKDRL